MPPTPQNAVSVVIPLHNGQKTFPKCLDALEACSPAPHEIIVVADGESDGSWCHARDEGCRTVVLKSQRGPAHARNVGAALATGNILLFIDSDVTVYSDIIYRLQTLFSSDAELAAVIGSYDDDPFEVNFVSQYRNLLHHFTHQQANEKATTFWGACGAVKRSIFLELGGFNEDYTTASIEDIEFGYRLTGADYAIRLDKELLVKHLKQWNFVSMVKTDIFHRAIPWSKLINAKGKIINDLNLRLKNRVSAATAICLLVSPLIWFSLTGTLISLLLGIFSSPATRLFMLSY